MRVSFSATRYCLPPIFTTAFIEFPYRFTSSVSHYNREGESFQVPNHQQTKTSSDLFLGPQ